MEAWYPLTIGKGGGAYPEPWLVAAYNACGYAFRPQELVQVETGKTWRTFHISEHRQIPNSGPEWQGASLLHHGLLAGSLYPEHPFLFAVRAIEAAEALRAGQRGVAWDQILELGQASPRVASGKRGDAESLFHRDGPGPRAAIPSMDLAGALSASGFILGAAKSGGQHGADGSVYFYSPAEIGSSESSSSRNKTDIFSLTFPELSIRQAVAKWQDLAASFKAAEERQFSSIESVQATDELLPGGHPFCFAASAVLAHRAVREWLAVLDRGETSERTLLLQTKARKEGFRKSTLVSVAAFDQFKDRIAQHLS